MRTNRKHSKRWLIVGAAVAIVWLVIGSYIEMSDGLGGGQAFKAVSILSLALLSMAALVIGIVHWPRRAGKERQQVPSADVDHRASIIDALDELQISIDRYRSHYKRTPATELPKGNPPNS